MTWREKLLWNMFPFVAHCLCIQAFIYYVFGSQRLPFLSLLTLVLQTVSWLLNSATFYRSRRLGSVSRDIPRKTQRAAFLWGFAACLTFYALHAWNLVAGPLKTGGDYARIIAGTLILLPMSVYQYVMMLLLVGQFRRFTASLMKDLDATVQGNDADVVHNKLVEGNEVSFGYFRKHIAVPFLPFFFMLLTIIAVSVVSLYTAYATSATSAPPTSTPELIIIAAYLSMVFLTCALCLFVFVEIDQKAYYLHMKLLKNTQIQKADLACLLIAYEHLVPRADILGVQVTTGRVAALIIPVVTAVLPKAFNALADYAKSH